MEPFVTSLHISTYCFDILILTGCALQEPPYSQATAGIILDIRNICRHMSRSGYLGKRFAEMNRSSVHGWPLHKQKRPYLKARPPTAVKIIWLYALIHHDLVRVILNISQSSNWGRYGPDKRTKVKSITWRRSAWIEHHKAKILIFGGIWALSIIFHLHPPAGPDSEKRRSLSNNLGHCACKNGTFSI